MSMLRQGGAGFRRVESASEFGRVAVLLGGRSAEREISLLSGRAVHAALTRRGVDAHAFDLSTGHSSTPSGCHHISDEPVPEKTCEIEFGSACTGTRRSNTVPRHLTVRQHLPIWPSRRQFRGWAACRQNRGGDMSSWGYMHFVILAVAVGVPDLVPATPAQDTAGDVSGTWKWSQQGPGGEMEFTLKIKQDGEKLTGTITGFGGRRIAD